MAIHSAVFGIGIIQDQVSSLRDHISDPQIQDLRQAGIPKGPDLRPSLRRGEF